VSGQTHKDAVELSRLPMPVEGAEEPAGAGAPAQPTPSELNKTASLPMPGDTAQYLTSEDEVDPHGSSAGASEPQDPELALARFAITRGLMVQSELDHCLKLMGERKWRKKTLTELLVEWAYVTPTQMMRLRREFDEHRAHEKGRKIPGYKMIGKIGEGASAAVFKARQLNLDRLVAIKVLPRRFSSNRRFVEQLYAEGRAAAQLNHKYIVQAYDVGQSGEFHYFVMEYVEGKTVHDLIQEQGRIEEEQALDIVTAVAEALGHAHRKGLIHRDVKPKNIMLTPEGIPKLADLGLARAIENRELARAERGKTLGTPYYISPEQVRGDEHIGPETDIYSLGATFFYMVTGRVPFEGADSSEVMEKHCSEPLEPPISVFPALTPGISEVIEKMMHKEPADRYRSAEDLIADLQAWKAYFVLKKGEEERGAVGA